jgi:hypothetical protein
VRPLTHDAPGIISQRKLLSSTADKLPAIQTVGVGCRGLKCKGELRALFRCSPRALAPFFCVVRHRRGRAVGISRVGPKESRIELSLSSLSRAAFFRFVRADRLLTRCLPERDGRRAVSLEMGLVTNQVFSLGRPGERTNPAKLFVMGGFPVSPPVNPMPACRPCRIRDSSRNSTR